MCSKNDCGSLVTLRDLLHDLPHEASGLGVHASRWLIKQNDRWVTDQCHCHRKLSLVTTAQSSSELIPVILQIEITDGLFDDSWNLVRANALSQSVELQSLFD